MNITADVINDLLPVYLSGEASADTRALIESYLRDHPTLAADVRSQAEKSVAAIGALSATLSPDHERATFEKIRSYHREINQFFAFGLAFTLVPFAFAFGNGHVTWVMLRDSPKQAAIFFAAAAYCWISHFVLKRRARTEA